MSLRALHAPSAAGPRTTGAVRIARSQVGSRRSLVIRNVASATESTFDQEVLKSSTPVLVDFWAPWCGPCKLVAPLMDWVEKEYAGKIKVVKIEHDPNPKLIEQYKVYGLPAIMLFKDGKDLVKREGAISKTQLQAWLKSHGFE